MRLPPGSRPIAPSRSALRARLSVQLREDRPTPAAAPVDVFHETVIAGSARGTQADTPDARIDPNTPSSQYAGVGSIEVAAKGVTFIGTGTVIGKRYVLTAAHVVDLNNDGKVDRKDGIQGVYFVLN